MSYILAIRPKPYPDESLWGFYLRTAEVNGYDSPTVLMRLAEIEGGEARQISPRIDRVARIYGRNKSDFSSIDWAGSCRKRGADVYATRGHKLMTRFVSIKTPKLCPLCVKEMGYIQASWDMTYMIACVKHKQSLISNCNHCNSRVSRFRPGLLVCRCGSEFLPVTDDVVPDHVLTLMEILERKYYCKSLQDMTPNGFPYDDLDKLSLAALLSFIEILGHYTNNVMPEANYLSESAEKPTPSAIVAGASYCFSNWPDGLHNVMAISMGSDSSSDVRTAGLRKRFKKLYDTLFRNPLAYGESGFIRTAFVEFASKKSTGTYADPRLTRHSDIKPTERSVVSVPEYARRTGLAIPTIKKLVNKKILAATVIRVKKNRRILIDLNQSPPECGSYAEHTLGLRQAGLYLGIPISVLKQLRSEGHFKVLHIPVPVECYRKEDLDLFRNEMLSKCDIIENDILDKENHILLKDVMRMKTGNPYTKTEVMVGILTNKLTRIGRITDSISDLVFNKHEIQEFVSKSVILNRRYLTQAVSKPLNMPN